MSEKTAVFAGSFDPFTFGHASVVRRGLTLFDRIVIAVGVNASKKTLFTAEQRLAQIQALYADEPRVEAVVWEGLTVDLARSKGAGFLLRSVRSVADFEYERSMAHINERLSLRGGALIQTVLLPAEPELESLQSSVVREILRTGGCLDEFVPEAVRKLF